MNTRAHQGFSLIELSIVMVIIGILLAASIAVMGPSMREAAATRTEKYLEANMNALKGYAGANGAVPTAAGFSALLSYPNDGGNNAFLYDLDNNLTTTGAICARNSTNLSVLTTSGTPITDVAFILYSKGNDGTVDLTSSGTAPELYDMDPYSETWDDLAGWVTLSELQGAANCGSSSQTLQFLSPTILPGCGASGGATCSESDYSTNVRATGGTTTGGNYLWCLSANSLDSDFILSADGALSIEDCADSTDYSSDTQMIISKPAGAAGSVLPNTESFTLHLRDDTGKEITRTFGITAN